MKMSKLNLCELLKGHEEEEFYCVITDRNVELREVGNNYLIVSDILSGIIVLYENGACIEKGNCMLFPFNNKISWKEWEDKNSTYENPKTWSNLIQVKDRCKKIKGWEQEHIEINPILFKFGKDVTETINKESIIKSTEALLKIRQLIQICYGGIVTNKELKEDEVKYRIRCYYDKVVDKNEIKIEVKFMPIKICNNKSLITFHKEEQAKEFLKHEENIQLLKDYYIV